MVVRSSKVASRSLPLWPTPCRTVALYVISIGPAPGEITVRLSFADGNRLPPGHGLELIFSTFVRFSLAIVAGKRFRKLDEKRCNRTDGYETAERRQPRKTGADKAEPAFGNRPQKILGKEYW